MTITVTNNASGYLATALSTSDVGVVLRSGEGAAFPTLTGDQYFYLTLISTGGTLEIVKVTARSGDTMSIVRAQESTTAKGFAVGSRAELRVTAQTVSDVVAAAVIEQEALSVAAVEAQEVLSVAAVEAQEVLSVAAVEAQEVLSVAAVATAPATDALAAIEAASDDAVALVAAAGLSQVSLVEGAGDAEIALVAAAGDAAVALLDDAGSAIIAAASARVFNDDTTALAALAASESGWVRPVYGTHANSMYDNAGATARRFGETLVISQAGIDIGNIKALQSLQELTTPFPAAVNRLWHHRAMDTFATDGRAIPNRLASTIPERWNVLNFSDGEIRIASLGNASTITLNASGTAARFDIAEAQFAGLLPSSGYGALLSNFAGGWVFGMDTAAVSVSEDIRIGQAATAYQSATIATGTIAALTPMVFSQANYDGAGQLIIGVPVTAGVDEVSIYVDNLKLYEGTTLPSGSGVDKDWHMKANFATRGALRPITSLGGYGIDLRQRRMAVSFDNTTEEVICAGHGLQTGDGPFKVALQYLTTTGKTFTADASTDRITITGLVDDIAAGLADGRAPGPFYLTTTTTLPGGLAAATPYWLHGITTTTMPTTTLLKLATSEANALAGIAVDITDAGTGTHTIKMTAPTGITIDLSYFVIRVSEGRFKLATTRPRAIAGTNITFTTDGTGAFYLDSVNMPAVAVPTAFPVRSVYTGFTLSVTWEAVPNVLFDTFSPQSPYLASVIKDTVTFTADAGTDVITISPGPASNLGSIGPFYLTTTNTLPDGLSLATPYWLTAVSGSTAKLATSYANALAEIAVNIIDAGIGTHTLSSMSRDNLAIAADPYTTFLHKYPESADVGQIRLADLGCQVLTTTVNAADDCLWVGYAPLLDKVPTSTTSGWTAGLSVLGMTYFGYYAGTAPATAALVTPSNVSGVFRGGHGYSKRLSATEMDAHIDAERAQLALEGKQTSSAVTMHIIVGTSIDALTTSWAYKLGLDTTVSPRFNNANKAVGGSSLSQTNGTTFPTGWIPYATSQYGAEAAFRGCLKNGWNVVLWIGGLANDPKQIINWQFPGTYAQDPGSELDLTPAEYMAFGQRFIDIGKENPAWAGKYAVVSMMTAPRSGFTITGKTFEDARVPFNTAVEALVNAATDDGWFYVSYAGTDMNNPASTTNPDLYSGDGLHWADGGHVIVAARAKTKLTDIYSYLGVS